jgi:hypothetical protein
MREGSEMGDRTGRRVGDAFEGRSEFAGEDNLSSLEEAIEEAAKQASLAVDEDIVAGLKDQSGFDNEYEVRITINARPHNQHVRAYRVIITPSE